MPYCINCGKELPDGARFCTFCGTSQTAVNTEENVADQGTVMEQPNSVEQRNTNEAGAHPTPESGVKMVNITPPVSSDKGKKRPHCLWGIGLFVAAIIAMFMSGWVGLIVYGAVFVLSIFILEKKGRLFGFAITALVIACIGIPWSVYEIVRDTKTKNRLEVVEEEDTEKKDYEENESRDGEKGEDKENKISEEPTCIEVEYGGIVFQVPVEFSTRTVWESGFDCYSDGANNTGLIFCNIPDLGLPEGVSDQDLEKAYDIVLDHKMDNVQMDLRLEDEKKYYVDGILCKEQDYSFSATGLTGVFRYAVMINTDEDEGIITGFICADEDDVEQYEDVYDTMMRNAQRINGTEVKMTTRQDNVSNSDNNGGVDPDLKAYLDSYEAFVNEYVDFMKRYLEDPTNVVSMLDEYSDIMDRLSEFEKQNEIYESSDMSTEDMAYFIDVTARCTKKMLEVYTN